MDSITYRKALQDIHRHLTDDNVKGLKFLVQPVIKKRRHDEIQTGFQFFDALEDSDMLSKDNLVILSALLEAVRRVDMKLRLEDHILMTDAVAEENKYLVCPFRKLLYQLREEIPEDDLSCMRYMCDNVPRRFKINDPLDLFTILIQEDCLGPDKLDFLIEILVEINRNDLVKKIRRFQNTVDPKDCGYKQGFSKQWNGIKFCFGDAINQLALYDPEYRVEFSACCFQLVHEVELWFKSPSKESLKISSKEGQDPAFQKPSYESFGSNQSSSSSSLKDQGHLFGQDSMESESQLSSSGPEFQEAAVESLPQPSLQQEHLMPIQESMNVEQGPPPFLDTVTHIPNGHNYHMQRDKRDCYKMDAKPRGPCLIIDVEDFTYDETDGAATQLTKRKGSSIDRAALTDTFKSLYFDVKSIVNPTDQEICAKLVELSKTPMHKYDCLVICILSHGGLGYFYGSNGRKVNEDIFKKLFSAEKCPSLANKPKLFFFSFCRGKEHQPAVPVENFSLESIQSDGPCDPQVNLVPNTADFMYGYATVPDSVAYRSTTQGTFYIDTLTRVLKENAHRDEFLHILLEVNRRVAERDYPNPRDHNIKKQVPEPKYTLRKKLYFL